MSRAPWVPLPAAPESPACPTCSGEMFRGHYDEWTCAACWRHVRAASEHAAFGIQRDFDPEGTLREPDRSDDREQVIYEGTHFAPSDWDGEPLHGGHPSRCPCWDCHPQLGPTADNH